MTFREGCGRLHQEPPDRDVSSIHITSFQKEQGTRDLTSHGCLVLFFCIFLKIFFC